QVVAERGQRRSVADEHRLHRAAAGRATGSLHGDAHLHAHRLMIVCAAATVCLLAPVSPRAGAGRPRVSLVAAPARVTLDRMGHRAIQVTNSGSERVVVDITRAGYGLGLRGRPRIVLRRARADTGASWLAFRPRRLAIPPGVSRSIVVASRLPRRAEPGDH